MNEQREIARDEHENFHAEFDSLADHYHAQHSINIAVSGESPEYFSEYKIADLANLSAEKPFPHNHILDFGCGIGNSVPYFRKYFPTSEICCSDVSSRSIEIAKYRNPGSESYVLIREDIPLPTNSQDVIFSACVFHHIPHEKHHYWLSELHRVARPGALIVIYEHNPLNPLTVHAVNTCPLDVNAHLIRARTMRRRALQSGWNNAKIDYRVFFPSALKSLRPLERHLSWLGLGAQYRLTAYKAS